MVYTIMICVIYIVQYFFASEQTYLDHYNIYYSWLLLSFVSLFVVHYQNVETMLYSNLLLLFYITALSINYSTFDFVNFSICCQHAVVQSFPLTGKYNQLVSFVLSCFMFTYVRLKKSSADDVLLSILFTETVYFIFAIIWKFF